MFRRLFVLLALLSFVAAAALPFISAEANDPLPVVGECSLYYRVYARSSDGSPVYDADGNRVYTRHCESTVVIPRMWALGQTNAAGELSNQWCALISETRPGVDAASDLCFPGHPWRYNTVICRGMVDSDDVWECDDAIGGPQNRMTVENLRRVYDRHLERLADLNN